MRSQTIELLLKGIAMILHCLKTVRIFAGLVAVLIFYSTCAHAEMVGTSTLTEGSIVLIRGGSVYTASEGVLLREGDILQTDVKGHAQIDFTGGTALGLGADTQVLLLSLPANGGNPKVAIATGWAKFVQKKARIEALQFLTPVALLIVEDGTGVLRISGTSTEMFVESGAATFTGVDKNGASLNAQTVLAGEFAARKNAQPVVTSPRPATEFISSLPRQFKDKLQMRLDKFKNRNAEPKLSHDIAHADVGQWLSPSASFRKNLVRQFRNQAGDPEYNKTLVVNPRERPELDSGARPVLAKKADPAPSKVNIAAAAFPRPIPPASISGSEFNASSANVIPAVSSRTSGPKRLALLVGNDVYRNLPQLANAGNDARLIGQVLDRAGFDVTIVTNVDRVQFWKALDRFKSRITKGDEVVFFFAGHGVQIASNQLLLPIEILAENDRQVERDGIALVDVQDALRDSRFAMLVIDACRDNPFPQKGTRSIGSTRGLLPPDPATGQVIVMSAGRNQRALDSVPGGTRSNSLFSWTLANVIQERGVEVRSALEHVKEQVDDLAKRDSHEQRPSLVSDLRGNFYFFDQLESGAVSR